jgi:hypothetical protein
MPKGTKGEPTKRRDFLKLASVSVPAAAVAATLGTAAEAATVEDSGEGMRDTPHTRAYFESARF